MRGYHALDQRRGPEIIGGSGVGENIDAALDGDFDSLIVGNVSEDGFAGAMSLGCDRLGQVYGHGEDAIGFDRVGKNLDAVGTVVDLLAHSFCRLGGGFNFGYVDVVGFEEIFYVNRSFDPEGLADGEDSGSFYFSGFYSLADGVRVGQHRGYVEDRSKTPTRENFLQLRSKLLGREFFGVEQAGSEDMHMAVPETGGHGAALAVDHCRVARDFDGCRWPYGNDAAIMHDNGSVFDWGFGGRGINSCMNQSEVRAESRCARGDDCGENECEENSGSHASNIRQSEVLYEQDSEED